MYQLQDWPLQLCCNHAIGTLIVLMLQNVSTVSSPTELLSLVTKRPAVLNVCSASTELDGRVSRLLYNFSKMLGLSPVALYTSISFLLVFKIWVVLESSPRNLFCFLFPFKILSSSSFLLFFSGTSSSSLKCQSDVHNITYWDSPGCYCCCYPPLPWLVLVTA